MWWPVGEWMCVVHTIFSTTCIISMSYDIIFFICMGTVGKLSHDDCHGSAIDTCQNNTETKGDPEFQIPDQLIKSKIAYAYFRLIKSHFHYYVFVIRGS